MCISKFTQLTCNVNKQKIVHGPLRSRCQRRTRHVKNLLEEGTEEGKESLLTTVQLWYLCKKRRKGRGLGRKEESQTTVQLLEKLNLADGESLSQSHFLEEFYVSLEWACFSTLANLSNWLRVDGRKGGLSVNMVVDPDCQFIRLLKQDVWSVHFLWPQHIYSPSEIPQCCQMTKILQ